MNRTAHLPLSLLLGLGLITLPATADDADGGLFAEEKPAPVQEADEEATPEATEEGEASVAEGEAETQEGEAAEEAEPDPRELAERAADLNRELREVQNELRQMQAQGRQRGANQADLDLIVLPENPTRADYETYIKAIEEATQGQNSFSSGDPQVEMLAKVPAEHIDLLIAQIGGRSSLRFHAQYAMRNIDMTPLRGRINELVLEQPTMIGVVVTNGWSRDAAEAIAAKLESRPPNLGPAWFQAAAELRDPALYDALHDCAIQSRYFTQVIQVLEGLPDYDLHRTIGELWRISGEGNTSINRHQVATVAVRFGYVDALGELINQLNARSRGYYSNNGENTYDTQRAIISRYIDFTGTHEEIAQWFADNKDQLVFDHITERYLTPDQIEQF